jgi:peptide/nickel transport system substrate-binding protein
VLRRKGRPSRYLAAVVFTDIAGSTELAARLGDRGWKQLLERHLRLIRSSLHRFGGREIDTAGDGLYATFESPAQAIAFALDIADRVEALGIRVRSGVHMGEVELIGGKAGGIAVHIGARIAARAEPGEVLVSGTVRDLVTGSGVGFADRGPAELKGVPGTWALYAATSLERRPAELPPDAPVPMRERISTRLRSTRWRVALVAILVAAVAGSAIGASVLLQPRYLHGVEANSVGHISGGEGGIVSALQVGSVPDAIAFGAGSLWVTDTTTGSVARIDPKTSLVVETIPVRSSPNGVATGHGAIWVTNGNDRSVSRVSPLTNQVIDTIPVGNGPSGVAADEHWVWVTNRLDGTLARIDPQKGDAETFRIGTTPAGVAAGAGSVWASDFDTGEVVRVDPSTGVPIYRIRVGNGPTSIAVGDGQVWVVNSRDGTVSRIDPGTNSVAATIAVGAEPGVVAAGRSVWVTVSSSADIVQIDAATNLPVRRIAARSRPRGIVEAEGDAWFTARADTGSHRGGTLRIIGEEPTDVPSTLDPAKGSDEIHGMDHVFLTNDGLVGFKRVGGSEGLTLVPDLAVAIPTPTDGGRSYSFKLRDGITYSDGTPLRALDVRRSFERIFSVNEFPLGSVGFLEGAEACASAPAMCDLSSSVVVDEGARTVTFKLIAPDPEFLFKLTDPTVVVLPADTPRELATVPLPATGPYMAEPFDANGGLRLVRNQFFHEWSHEAQPFGYPDVIEWRIAGEGEDSTALVAADQADSTQWNDAFTAARIDQLRTQFTDQLHALPPSATWFQFMNTSLPPFNRPEVRRAVNLATDRKKVVELFGGDIAGRVTCQATPSGFPGYEPYCPYTVNPGNTWTAADMATARRLIDSAGVRGTPVTVWSVEFARPEFRNVNAYFVDLLNQLGFKASLKSTSLDEFFTIQDEYTANIQMIGLWNAGFYPTPSSFIAGTFTCPDFRPFPGSDGNYAHFCDRTIDEMALSASDLQATDPALANQRWAEVDHEIVDQSPAVAAFNPIQLAFVSKRVGNVQVHPVLRVLISQMWVQ